MQTLDPVDVLWITAGLGCDGDTIAMTAATPIKMPRIDKKERILCPNMALDA